MKVSIFKRGNPFMSAMLPRLLTSYQENALYINFTYQFDDYSQMAFDYVPEEVKREYRDAHFPEDLKRAKELGRRLVEEAKQRKNS